PGGDLGPGPAPPTVAGAGPRPGLRECPRADRRRGRLRLVRSGRQPVAPTATPPDGRRPVVGGVPGPVGGPARPRGHGPVERRPGGPLPRRPPAGPRER